MKIKSIFLSDYKKDILNIINQIDIKLIEKLKFIVLKTSKMKGCVHLIGNGGSISTAKHIAVDLLKNAKIKTNSTFSDNLITCFSNDYGHDNWMVKYFEYIVNKNDLVIFLSASGQSKNILKSAKFLLRRKINFFSLTGFKKNNKLNKISKNNIWVNSKSYNQVEISHFVILAMLVDSLIGKKDYSSKL